MLASRMNALGLTRTLGGGAIDMLFPFPEYAPPVGKYLIADGGFLHTTSSSQ